MTLASRIAKFAERTKPHELSDAVTERALQHLVDSAGCALGSTAEPLSHAVFAYLRSAGLNAAPLLVPTTEAHLGAAVLGNTAAIRMLDYNDTFPESHPSDILGAIVAHSGAAGASGADVLCAMLVGYETFVGIEGATDLRRRGWDQGVVVAIGVAAALGNLYRLSAAEIRHAVAIAATSCHATRVSRAGKLSHWKGLSTAFAAMQAGAALSLARAGVTGPDAPFEGRDGFFEQVSGSFAMPVFELPDGPQAVRRVWLKRWPIEYHTQLGVQAALAIREEIPAGDVASVDIATYDMAYRETASEPAKWRPVDRETADHSLPYVVAVALVYGAVTIDSFDHGKLNNPEVKSLMQRVCARVDEVAEARYPEDLVMTVTVTATDGRVRTVEGINPPGHHSRPLERAETDAKFLELAARYYGREGAEAALTRLWTLNRVPRAADIFRSIAGGFSQ